MPRALNMFGLFSKKSNNAKFWFKTDIHCHVLPGIDDGSPDVETSIDLVNGLRELGIERIIASPHIEEVHFHNNKETIDGAYNSLKQALDESGMEIPLSYSAEYRIDEGLDRAIAEGTLLPYPGKYVLIENQWVQEPWNLEQVIFDLQIKGFQPILAHPERFSYYQKNFDRLDDLHDKIPFQINMLSLAGYYGKAAKKTAERLLKKGYVDFLGTDTHHHRHIESLRKYLSSSAAARHRELSLATLRNDRAFKP